MKRYACKRSCILIGLALSLLSGCIERRHIQSQQEIDAEKSKPTKMDSLSSSIPAVQKTIQLFDVTDQSGIDFVHNDGSFGKFLLPETMSGGLALFDYDGDDLIDICFCNGASLILEANSTRKGNALFKNLGGLKFREVTREAGLVIPGFGLGVTVGDYDNDGFQDIFASNFGRNTLYHNLGDGVFEQVRLPFADGSDERFSAGACFADFDGDGNLDLFIANYVDLSPKEIPQLSLLSRTTYPGPQDFPPGSNQLLRNSGDGSWSDASTSSKISSVRGTGMGCITGDFDVDGDIDIFVVNDEMPNFFFRNDGAGTFDEVAFAMGIAVDRMGAASGSMGVDAGDLNNDGRCDLFVTTFENELVNYYQMTELGVFQDVTRQSHIGDGTLPHVKWGCCIADFDHDSDRDLIVASGHLDRRSGDKFYKCQNLVIQNLLQEKHASQFTNVTERCGDMASVLHCSRGAAVADIDNDGDLDVVVMNLRERPTLIENRSAQLQNHWLQIRLIGTSTNRDAIGARLHVVAGDLELFDEVRNGRGYQSYWGSRLHFGLGTKTWIDRIEIDWFDGKRQIIEHPQPDHVFTIVQDR